jgi:hypothetical protein
MNRRPSIEFSRISTMPRAQTEARGHLDRYQIAVEKARLEKELDFLETRRGQIHRRLQQLAHSAEDLDYKLNASPNNTANAPHSPLQNSEHPIPGSTSTESYQTFVLEF